jgi:hypothetical protein
MDAVASDVFFQDPEVISGALLSRNANSGPNVFDHLDHGA